MYSKMILEKIEKMPYDKDIPFSKVSISGVSVDTVRKNLHRLHDKGEITIVSRGVFRREKNPLRAKVFVYGSLKKGFHNHDVLSKNSKVYKGKATTVRKFGMFKDPSGEYPYLIDDKINKISGELYEIYRKEVLDAIDELEGAPYYYQRKMIKVKSHDKIHNAYVYIQENSTAPKDQEALMSWKNPVDEKVKRLHQLLEKMI